MWKQISFFSEADTIIPVKDASIPVTFEVWPTKVFINN